MPPITRPLSTVVASLVVIAGLTGSANAGEPAPAPAVPCSKETSQVAKAEDALARVTAVFERKRDKVAEARHDLKKAKSSEKAAARAALKETKVKKVKAAKVKKAQQVRLAKAQERLAQCQAEQEPTTV